MLSTTSINTRLTFSGHDTFHCRHLWLKKGYDFLKKGRKFSDEDAVVELGVGKNMVSSIYFWMKAFGIIDKDGNLSEIAKYILDDNGKDPYLEDEASLWLLHYNLIKQNVSSSYNLLFNEFRRERIEFTKEHFIAFVMRKGEELGLNALNKNTLLTDFDVLIKMYLRSDIHSKDKEDSYAGLLTELNLIQEERREIDKKLYTYYSIITDEKIELPDEVLLFVMLDNDHIGKSLSLYTIEQESNNAGIVFALGRTGIVSKIENLISNTKYKKYGITYADNAGVKEIQFKTRPNKYEILDKYYAS